MGELRTVPTTQVMDGWCHLARGEGHSLGVTQGHAGGDSGCHMAAVILSVAIGIVGHVTSQR